MKTEIFCLLTFFGGLAVVGNMDYADALIADAIRKDPPKILSYSIKQDSPGLKSHYERNPLPLTVPVQVKQ